MTHKGRSFTLLAAVAVLAVAAGIGAGLWTRAGTDGATAALRNLSLPDPSGKTQPLRQWDGKVVVVNFWATWCEPCREEVPTLVSAHAKWSGKGVEIVGIGIDSAAKIRQFSEEYKITYPLVVAGPEVIEITRELGNRAGGLPYTAILDRRGKVASTHLGRLTAEALDTLLAPLAAP